MAVFDLAAALAVVGLMALGMWQVHRRAWKLDLIARVEARIHAAPVPAPGPDRWPHVSAAADEYRPVTVAGAWLPDRTALVQALTELGGGYWVLTPLRRDDGSTVLVNRGFTPEDKRDPRWWTPDATGPVTVTGLLRLPEPGGTLLRKNDPASDRWYSRDVAAIAASRGLGVVAPYFIDAARDFGAGPYPVGGLTVVRFTNNHFIYAVTWFSLAAMAAAAAIYVTLDALGRRPAWMGRFAREGADAD